MPAALPFTSDISQSSSGTTEFKVLKNKYGNGYEQRVADGINNNLSVYSVVWENMTDGDSTTLIAAFETARGVDYFTWTPPKKSAGKFAVAAYSWTAMSGSIYTVSATLEQVADIT